MPKRRPKLPNTDFQAVVAKASDENPDAGFCAQDTIWRDDELLMSFEPDPFDCLELSLQIASLVGCDIDELTLSRP
jgi:hypothetical protein